MALFTSLLARKEKANSWKASMALFGAAPNYAKIVLFTNDINPGEGLQVTDLVQPTFSGYAVGNFTLSGPYNTDQGGFQQLNSGVRRFDCDAETDPPQVVYGYAILNPDATEVLFAERFQTPQTISQAGDSIAGVVRFTEPETNLGWISVEV